MKTRRALLTALLSLMFLSCCVGCATTPKYERSATAAPLEEPKKDSTWWEILGFMVLPIADAFAHR